MEKADVLAQELARLDGTSVDDAVVSALTETLENRHKQETPRETARRILKECGLTLQLGRKPLPVEAYHDLDHDLSESG